MADKIQLSILKQKRKQLRRNLTLFKNFLDNTDCDSLTDLKYNDLKGRFYKFEPGYDEFSQVQLDISCLLESMADLTEEQKEQELDEKNYFEDYFQLFAKAKTAIDKFEIEKSQQGSQHSQGSVGQGQVVYPLKVNLPVLNLPCFSGKIEDWLEFKDTFLAMIDNASPVQKLQYLRASLSNGPADLIASLKITATNWDVAWSLLEERYENNRLVVDTYIQGILDAPVVTRESYTELRKLFDTFNKNIRSLNALKQPTDQWDTLLIAILINKFDSQTRREWEAYKIKGTFPTWTEVHNFLKNKCALLEKLELTKTQKSVVKFGSQQFNKKPDVRDNKYFRQRGTFVNTSDSKPRNKFACYYCKSDHTIFCCDKFKILNVDDRNTEVRKLKLCLNCFNPSHEVSGCNKARCIFCDSMHNSLLCRRYKDASTGQNTEAYVATSQTSNQGDEDLTPTASGGDALGQNSAAVSTTLCSTGLHGSDFASDIIKSSEFDSGLFSGLTKQTSCSLLSTAVVAVIGSDNKTYLARCLIDQGSQSNYISEQFARKIGASLISANFQITGVGSVSNVQIKYQTRVKIQSRFSEYAKELRCLVIKQVTSPIPLYSFNSKLVQTPKNIELADPSFSISQDIDMLLGVDTFYDILIMEQIKLGKGQPILQRTQLGWIIGGELSFLSDRESELSFCNLTIDDALNQTLMKFWQLEEPLVPKDTDDYCERHYLETFEKDSSGRFIVQIPFKKNVNDLGDSKIAALRSLESLDRKFAKNTDLKKEYSEFISEYENLGHMTELKCDWRQSKMNESYLLPHHAVIKENSLTCHLRVVFNASSRTSSGLSLNCVQYTGPSIGNDLVSILIRFRKYKYVLNADISKMFRQILINPQHRPYQRILWRKDNGDITCYELNTVVYGMASSPFLAIRCLHQVASECESEYPVAARIIKNDMYMDDLLTGTESETELLTLQRDISKILGCAGFELRKWLSNKRDFCESFQVNDNLQASMLELGENEQNKTLGLYWNAYADCIQYKIRDFSDQTHVTKRKILSISSQIFDPLGLVQPVIIVAKLIVQTLWKEHSDWDAEISSTLLEVWINFCKDLQNLNQLKIPRSVISKKVQYVELHTFADESEKAYGVALYVRSINSDSSYSSFLLCSKAKVAPVRSPTLPRLELSAALIATRLTKKVIDMIQIDFHGVYYWSDSTITLGWIRGNADRFKTFVKNRVNEIQSLTNPESWYHVRSEENPADLVSRGCAALNLIDNKFWFQGPYWLREKTLPLTSGEIIPDTLPEQKTITNIAIFEFVLEFDLFSRFSSLSKLATVMGYCYRFINNCRAKKLGTHKVCNPYITAGELNLAIQGLVRISQIQSFKQVYYDLSSSKPISNNKENSILSLNPFFDKDSKLIRVGSRLHNANMSYSKKFPIILGKNHILTKLIFQYYHKTLLHCGPQQLLYTVRQKYWAPSGRSLARSILHNCVVCFRAKPKTLYYLMGNLPYYRINKFFPFMHTGCDYAGPFLIKDRKTRNPKLIKAYVVVFVCMTVKAVHLELVTELTSAAFLATFKRFIARRGKPTDLYCDNGTAFVGADSELKKFLQSNATEIGRQIDNDGVNFHFIPPRAPSFGGLWESSVKSCKFHLKRTIGNTHLHYEDFVTILTQVEGVLNSRPISPMSSNVDYSPLSPGHFLIGRPILSLPEPCLTEIPENRLTHFKRLQQILQHFWIRWSKEYISELQSRQKWFQGGCNTLTAGDLVLVKEDKLPPLKWKTARVLECFPGNDNVTRVVSIKFGDGSITKRALTKLCLLPIEKDNN